MDTKQVAVRLPPALELHQVPVAEALVALADRLTALAETMPLVTDVSCELSIDPTGRALLMFRATK